MADGALLAVSALGVVEGIAKLVGRYDIKETSKYLEDLFGELIILQNLIAESVLMMEELRDPPRYSAVMAIERCERLQRELESSLKYLRPDNNKRSIVVTHLRFTSREVQLKRVCESFKSAVLLVRDIATDSLTHEYLRNFNDVHGRVTMSAELNTNTMREPSASMSNLNNCQLARLDNTQHSQTTKAFENLGPTQKLSLFDATISYIVDVPGNGTDRSEGVSIGSKCACGRQRQGIWFPVRGKWDSGSDVELVSEDVIKRAKLEQFVVKVPAMVLLIFGVTFTFDRMITLNWQLINEETSYTCGFWIAKTTEFDLVVGETWMAEHGYGSLEVDPSKKKSSFFGMLKLGRRSRDQKKREAAKAESSKENATKKDEQRRAEEQRQWDEYRSGNSTVTNPHLDAASKLPGFSFSTSMQPLSTSTTTPSMTDNNGVASSPSTSITTVTLQPNTEPTIN